MHLTSSTFRHAISHYWCNVTRSARKWQHHSCRVFLLNLNLKKERKKAEKLFQAGFEPGTSRTKIVPSGIQTGDLSNTSLPPDCCTCWGITVEELEGYLICCLRCVFFLCRNKIGIGSIQVFRRIYLCQFKHLYQSTLDLLALFLLIQALLQSKSLI